MPRPKTFDLNQALLNAMRLFWRKGYAATSIEDLVEALNLSRSSIYGAFTDKRNLFLAALQLYSDAVIAGIQKTLNETEAPLEGIQKVFDNLVAEVGTDKGALGCFMVNSVAELVPYDADVTTIAQTYSEAIEGMLVEVLKRGAAQGNLTTERTPEALAAYLFNTIQGMRVLIKAGATRDQLEAIRDITLHSLQ